MLAHDLARKLLEGENLPVCLSNDLYTLSQIRYDTVINRPEDGSADLTTELVVLLTDSDLDNEDD